MSAGAFSAKAAMMDPFPGQLIAGVDEAGRGPLAGPVVAAAVILDPLHPIQGLKDSKLLTEKRREILACEIKSQALAYCIAEASVAEIDAINILKATFLAMRRAIEGLKTTPEQVLVDGNRLPEIHVPAQAIIQGDRLVDCISAASILAKVSRDTLMVDYHRQYPDFAFHRHKGYGTRLHLEEMARFGCLDIHRRSFAPVRKVLEQKSLLP
jgi:ribonuclease HII